MVSSLQQLLLLLPLAASMRQGGAPSHHGTQAMACSGSHSSAARQHMLSTYNCHARANVQADGSRDSSDLNLGTSARVLPRRAVLAFSLTMMAIMPGSLPPASALFESKAELGMQAVASSLPRVETLISEVTQVKRLRTKFALDPEDDAYVLRFARSVLLPLKDSLRDAAPALGADADALAETFATQLQALDTACVQRSAAEQIDQLQNIEQTISAFLALGKSKFNVSPRDDINTYSGAKGILYNKFLFRAG